MSRSNYDYDLEPWEIIRWRGAVKSAIRGRRGQSLLREMLNALDALPEKTLIANELEADGQFCALGAVGKNRDIDLQSIEPDDYLEVANTFGVAAALVREIAEINDIGSDNALRWKSVRAWVASQIIY